jgi:hypothetical protein
MKKEYFKFLWVALFLSILSMSCSKKSDPKLEEEEEEEQEQIVFQKDLAAVGFKKRKIGLCQSLWFCG